MLVVGSKVDQQEESVKENALKRTSSIAEEVGADELIVVRYSICCDV